MTESNNELSFKNWLATARPDQIEATNKYKHLSITGKLIEQWERDENGEWHDVTAREKARIEIEEAKAEIARLERLEARRARMANKKEGG